MKQGRQILTLIFAYQGNSSLPCCIPVLRTVLKLLPLQYGLYLSVVLRLSGMNLTYLLVRIAIIVVTSI